jgi:KDO2-lipid IV(A) lauroyltransferase
MKNYLEFLVFIAFSFVARLFGLKNIHIFAKFLAFLFYRIIPIRKKVVIENLKMAFPEKSESEILKLTKANYLSFAITFSELLILKTTKIEELKAKCTSSNGNEIVEEFKKGNGILLVSAHFGNWEFGALWLNLFWGIGISVLAKKQRNLLLSNWLTSMRNRFGNKEIYTGESFLKIIRALKNKEIVGIVGDQRGRKDSIRIKFFGRETAVFTGAGGIAAKMNIPMFFGFAKRDEFGNYQTTFYKITCDKQDLSDEEKTKILTQKYFTKLEEVIRENPEQWFWMHNIWKY